MIARKLIAKFFGDKNTFDVRRELIARLIAIELHHDDWSLLNDIHAVLKPFYLATRLVSKRSYPTAGLCYYTIKLILNYLKYSFFNPLGFSVLGEDDVCIIEQEIKQVIRNESIHLNDPFSTSSCEPIPSTLQPIVTANASQTSASDHKQSLSTIDQFLLACGESPISNLQKSETRKLTIDDELCVYK
ncbi:unnamed protein product, partial [Adineta ricciae]